MANLSGTEWGSYVNPNYSQTGGSGSKNPQMFQQMASGLGQSSGNTAPGGAGTSTPPTTLNVGGTLDGTGGTGLSGTGTLFSDPLQDLGGGVPIANATGTPSPATPTPPGGSFTVPGLGLVPGLDDFRAFMSYSNPTQQSIKQLMTNSGIFDQFSPYLQRDASVTPWALNALGAYGPQPGTSTIPLGGASGTPFDGYDPAALMTLLQQHGIASQYQDPTAQTTPTQVPTSQPPPSGPEPTLAQQQVNRQQDARAYDTALTAATGGVAGDPNKRNYTDAIRQNVEGMKAFNNVGGMIQAGTIADPFRQAGLPSLHSAYGYVAPDAGAPVMFADARSNIDSFNQLSDWAIANNRPDIMTAFFQTQFPDDPNVMNAYLHGAFGGGTPTQSVGENSFPVDSHSPAATPGVPVGQVDPATGLIQGAPYTAPLPTPGVNLGGNAIGQPGGYGAVAPGAIDPATGLMQGAPVTPMQPGMNLGGAGFTGPQGIGGTSTQTPADPNGPVQGVPLGTSTQTPANPNGPVQGVPMGTSTQTPADPNGPVQGGVPMGGSLGMVNGMQNFGTFGNIDPAALAAAVAAWQASQGG